MVKEAPEPINLFAHNFSWLAVQEAAGNETCGDGRRLVRVGCH